VDPLDREEMDFRLAPWWPLLPLPVHVEEEKEREEEEKTNDDGSGEGEDGDVVEDVFNAKT
jgi:hypothetical protein